MKTIDIQMLMLEYIRQNPNVTEEELLENITITLDDPEDKKLVKAKLIEGLFYGGLITVRLTEDGKDRTFKIRSRDNQS